MLGGFQPTAFQPNVYQNTSVEPAQLGETVVIALSQTRFQGKRSAYIAGSAVFVSATYTDIDGNPFIPAAVSYNVTDVVSGTIILDFTPVPGGPALTNDITVTSTEMAMISLTRPWEQHQVCFKVTDGLGNIDFARTLFLVYRIPPPGVCPIN